MVKGRFQVAAAFQSTPLREGRRKGYPVFVETVGVSIHAPA